MKMKILIVDDEPGIRSVLKLIIEQHGHDVLEAGDGQDGLDKALQHKPDAIISDALMPKMDGFQFLRAVRQAETLSKTPFIFYTSIYTGDKEYELALSLGADALIIKPKAPGDFWKEFTSALDAHASNKKPAPQTWSIEREEDHLRDYCRIVAAKLEEKVRELETVIADHEYTKLILQEREERYRLLFENNPHPMWVYDLDTLAFLTVNDAAIYQYGYSREEFLSMTIKDIRPPEDVPALIDRVSKVHEGFDEAHIWRHRKKDGSIIDVEITSHSMIFAGRRAKLILANDVTERRRMEQQIRKSANEWSRTFDSINDAIALLDSNGKILRCNRAMAKLLGRQYTDIVGHDCREIIYDVSANIEDWPVALVRKTRKRETGVLPLNNRWFEITADPLFDDSGVITGAVHIMVDITERKHQEDAFKAAVVRTEDEKARADSIIAAIGDGLTIQDRDFRILYQNQSAINMIGDHVGELCFMAYEKREKRCEGCPVAMVFGDGEVHTVVRSAPTDKGIMFFEITASPLRDSKGKIIAGIEIVHDITARKKAEDVLKEERNRAQKYLDVAGVMIVALDSVGRITLINKKGLEILGYEEHEVINRNWFELCMPGHVRETFTGVFNKLMAGDIKLFEYYENPIVIKDGGERIITFHNTILRNESGEISGVLFSGEDITEQRRNRDELSERVHQAALGAEIGVVLTRGGGLRTKLQLCAEAMALYLDAAFARIWTFNERENILEMQASAGMYTHINGAHSRVPVGKFKIGLIAEERKPHLTNHVIGDPRVGDQEWAIKEGMVGFAGYPLIVQDRLVGVMAMFSHRQIPEATMSSLASVADVIALGIERKRTEEELASYSGELTELNMASDTLMLITNLKDIYEEICNIIYTVFDLKMVWLGIIGEGSFEVTPVAHAGFEDGYLSTIGVTWDDSPTGMGPTGMAIKTRKPAKIDTNEPAFAVWKAGAQKRGYETVLSIPLIYARDICIGALNFYSDNSDYFTPDRIKLCQIFANQAAIAIENARLIEELEGKVLERTKELEDANRELQSMNKELVLRREEADAASRSKTDFLANMSHELRTPLNSILGFSDIMQAGMAGPVTDKQKEFLNDIYTSGDHLLALITDILDLSKIEAGKMELEPVTFTMKELIDASLIMFKEKALKHAIKVSTEIDNTITGITADKRKLKQVMVNLLSNAFKFTPDGGSVHVAARRVVRDLGLGVSEKGPIPNPKQPTPDRDFIEISVSDTGIGISQENLQRLFQPFQQIETSLTRKYAGTGLGLSLCRRFVELHGGRIWAESGPGKGSRFTFIIPMKQ